MNKYELPNGLVTYKYMLFKSTNEKCQIIKVNLPVLNNDKESAFYNTIVEAGSVDIQVFRKVQGIPFKSKIFNVSPYDLITWNESMNPHREVKYKRRKKGIRTVIYN